MTWETEDEMKNKYPYLFPVPVGNSIPSLTILIDKRDYVVSCNSVRHLQVMKCRLIGITVRETSLEFIFVRR